MSVVSLLGVKILNNPAPFTAPYEFEITFECLEQLREGRSPAGTEKHGRLIGFRSRVEVDLRRLCHVVRFSHSPVHAAA